MQDGNGNMPKIFTSIKLYTKRKDKRAIGKITFPLTVQVLVQTKESSLLKATQDTHKH